MLLRLLVDTRGLGVAPRLLQQLLLVEVQRRAGLRRGGLVPFDRRAQLLHLLHPASSPLRQRLQAQPDQLSLGPLHGHRLALLTNAALVGFEKARVILLLLLHEAIPQIDLEL